MNIEEFEIFVHKYGKDILRFCRMTAHDKENGDELYQDTMLKLLEKRMELDPLQNTKSYALSISVYLWKNRKKKHLNRARLAPMSSIEEQLEGGGQLTDEIQETSPEQFVLQQDEIREIRNIISALPEKYRLPVCLYYSADMPIRDISKILHLPEGTVKSRMRKAKKMIKEKLEALGYDR